MAKQFTQDYGFVKPLPGTGEFALIEEINSNFDKVEKWARVIWVNDGVTPSTADLIDGATVAEKTSGKVWIAQKNVGGTFDRKWLRYPYLGVFTDSPNIASGGNYQEWGTSTWNSGKNSSVANISGGRFVIPVEGIWSFKLQVRWNANTNGDRWAAFAFNGTVAQIDFASEVNGKPNAANGFCAMQIGAYDRYCVAGNTIVPCLAQTSPGALTAFQVFSATLIEAF